VDYKVQFRGLAEGKHHFEYNINDTFFEAFAESEIKKGKLFVIVDLIKRSTGMEVDFNISGFVEIQCDRCLDYFNKGIEYSGKLFFEYGEKTEEVSDELTVLSYGENYLNLDKYIYEFINLSLPIQKIHPDDENGNSTCNAEMLKKLDKYIINNNQKDEIDDPRWGKQRDLIN
jgi:uncharacterized metal-binding protein YceD (DUF177 family)